MISVSEAFCRFIMGAPGAGAWAGAGAGGAGAGVAAGGAGCCAYNRLPMAIVRKPNLKTETFIRCPLTAYCRAFCFSQMAFSSSLNSDFFLVQVWRPNGLGAQSGYCR